jgi:CRISPR-associated endonuclease/helicase Cas3
MTRITTDRFSQLPIECRALWAKSGELQGHGLLAHMLDVAASAEAILRRESKETRRWASHVFGLGEDMVPRWLAAICGLHDFGKAIPGFQAKWPEGRQSVESAGLHFVPEIAMRASRHDLASAALLRPEFAHRFEAAPWIHAITQALGAHHGYFPREQEIRDARPMREGAEWANARRQLLDAYLGTLVPDDEPAAVAFSLPAIAWLAGLTSVADWIASNQEWFPAGERADLFIAHHDHARELAELALDCIGWSGFHPLLVGDTHTDALVARILGRAADRATARPLQVAADQLLRTTEGPVLMIVEAPMGEGKTELAFLSHLQLQVMNGHRGLYVALPTQATGNAMFDRALTFLKSFAPDVHLDIQLVHGGAMLDERIHQLRGINASEDESITSSAWFSQRKRPLLSPYGVGTIDQALFATLHVKHHFVRLWGLSNRVVVLDEIHAYDTYTSGLIEALLRWLKALNCSVVLMSATLPAKRRAAFLRAWSAHDGPDIDYPRILLASGASVQGEHVPCRSLAPIEVVGIPEDLDSLALAAMEGLSGGGCGVVVVNTVQRAQNVYSVLKDKIVEAIGNDAELLLFHARYPADERSERENLVLSRFGRGNNVVRPARALLIATQVVEQSLDIDFDFMITDLAPVDLLLQRAGRLHRHVRLRPDAHAAPRLIVAGLQRDRMPELKETAWGFVYDPYVLYRTWDIAGAEPVWRLPEDIDRLVQLVYASDPFEAEEREEYLKTLDQALGEHLARVQDQRRQAMNVALDAEAELSNAYISKPRANEEGEGVGLRVVTRLGEDSLTVVPILASAEGWRLFATDVPFDPNTVPGPALAQFIHRRQVRLSRKDLVKSLLAQPIPKAFESHPLLRNLRPLIFIDGRSDFDRLRVRLDPELGITFETTKKEDA